MKIFFELQDRGWYFEFYNMQGKMVSAGLCETFFECCAACLELVRKEKAATDGISNG